MTASPRCHRCGYELCGLDLQPDASIICPECSAATLPGESGPPSVAQLLLPALTPAMIAAAGCIFSAIARVWEPTASSLGLALAAFVLAPAATFVGLGIAAMEYKSAAPRFWRRWWHKPALFTAVIFANLAIATTALLIIGR